MKTRIKFLGLVTLALITVFAMISCDSDEAPQEAKTDAVRPLITVDPLNAAYLPGATVTPLSVTASASDGGTLSYQWYSGTTEYGSNPTAITGATSATFTPPATTAGTLYYYAEVTNTNNGVNGNKTAVYTSRRAKFVVGWEKVDVLDIESSYVFSPQSIIFANNLFVAVGGYISVGGQIGWSDDGIKWKVIESTPFGTSVINGIAYGNGKFIAVGEDGKMASSTDGKTWTSVDASAVFGTSNIYDIAYGNNQFYAVGSSTLLDNAKCGYSKDNGATWTSTDNTFKTIFGNYISGIVYDSVNGFTAFSTTSSKCAIFIETGSLSNWGGLAIQNSDGTATITTIKDLVSANNYIVAVGNDGNVLKYTGILNWTDIKSSTVLGTNTINKAAYGANKLLVFSSDKGAWSGDDGATWTEVPYINMSRMAYGAGRFVAVGGSGISYSKYP